jgi:hypothetical protein
MQRYVRQFLCFVALYLGGAAAFNLVVDPQRVFGLVEWPSIAPYKAQSLEAAGKAEVAARGGADVVLLGDSRVMIGLDPSHPALAREGRVENLAFAGASAFEAARMLQIALDAPHPPRLVLWGVDAESLASLARADLRPHLLETRLNPDVDLWRYYRRHLVGQGATGASIDVLRRSLFRTRIPWTRSGQKIDWEVRAPNAYLANHGTLAPRLKAQENWSPPEQTGMEACEPWLASAQQAGVRLILFLPPSHALFQEALYPRSELRKYRSDCLIDLVLSIERLNAAAPRQPPIELWDFTGFTEWHTEPFPTATVSRTLRWHWDAVHFRDELGDIVLDRMLGDAREPAELGARLSSETLPGHFARWDRDRGDYRTARLPDDAR